MKKLLTPFLLLAFIFVFSIDGYAQCKGFTKKDCLPVLDPYIYNGQLNSALLNEGDVAELLLTFYGNQEYRLLICSQEILGNVEFNLLDKDRNLIFSNKDHNYTNMWDFTSTSTQQLIIEVVIPESTNEGGNIVSGCVSILMGFLSTE